MIIYVLDKNFNTLSIVDEYQSILWIDRYNKPGEFELYLGADSKLLEYLKIGNYLTHRDSQHLMVIESIRTETNVEEGDHFTITGRSIEAFLGRRIVWKQTDFDNVSMQSAIERLLNDNVINPELPERRIGNVIFQQSFDERITSLRMSAQYTGDNLLDVITDICESFKVGFKMIPDNSYNFVFSLFVGDDRSYDQTVNNYVIFSPSFDNIINTNYYESDIHYCNVTLVSGEGEGVDRITQIVGDTPGLERREYWTDARDLSTKDEDNNEIPIEEYYEMLRQRGREKLTENRKDKTFDGKVDPAQTFKYGEDFFIGDIVQIRNEFGIEGSARIVEYIMSESVNNGLEYYPTFEAIQEEAEE